jgi:hypothetical protein
VRRPTGDGTASGVEWAVYPVSPASHYDKVDEPDPHDGDATIWDTIEDLTNRISRVTKAVLGLPAGATITAVRLKGYAKKVSGGAVCNPALYFGFRIGGVDSLSADLAPSSTSYTLYSVTWGSVLTEAQIDSAEILAKGISCRQRVGGIYYYNTVNLTQFWLEVDYTEAVTSAKRRLLVDVGL